jgi:hypothetical protein
MDKYIAFTSYEAYYLFNDQEWISLLRNKGVDLDRSIRYNVIKGYGVFIHYDDTFIGGGI